MSTDKSRPQSSLPKLDAQQRLELEVMMDRLVARNPSWNLHAGGYRAIFPYFVAQKLFFLHDDEVYELMKPVDASLSGKQEELLDHYMVLDTVEEVQLKLFQFKFTEKYDKGVSTKELYAFVERMNKSFLKGDLLEEGDVLEAYREARAEFERACRANPKATRRVHCYYVVNGQNLLGDDPKLDLIRTSFLGDRQAYGFTFETYGGLDIYNLAVHGRVPIRKEHLELELPKAEAVLHWDIGKNPGGMPLKVVQGFVNVNQLIRLVDRYSNNELFEKNVRLFLGVKKEVNRRIVETITSAQSNWFAFMNNGVSITADNVVVNRPPIGGKLGIVLDNMQIINGCQTVSALYHAKYDPELKDRFQGNSQVLVRIYHIDPANTEFMEALIIATNSQNAIRAEDLVSADPPQKALEEEFSRLGVSYQRKQGGAPKGHPWLETTKETAAMAFIAVFWEGFTSKLRNAASRREIFRRGDDYLRIFSWGADQPDELPLRAASVEERARQMLLATVLVGRVRAQIAEIDGDKVIRGSLKKGSYFIARGIRLRRGKDLDAILSDSLMVVKAAEMRRQMKKVEECANTDFGAVREVFEKTLATYGKKTGGDADAALKNSAFARQFEAAVQAIG